MPLPKYLRPRWRYLALEVATWPDADLSRDRFQRAIWYAAQDLLGDPGSADADLSVMRFEFADGRGEAIVRVRRGEVEPARAAIACCDRIDGRPVGLSVRGVSGTIRACEEKYLSGPGESPDNRDVVFEGERRPAVVRDDAVDLQKGDTFTGATLLDTEEH